MNDPYRHSGDHYSGDPYRYSGDRDAFIDDDDEQDEALALTEQDGY